MAPIVSVTAGGIDIESIITGLMQVERIPISTLQLRQSKVQLQSDALGRLRNSLDSLKSLASSVVTGGIGKVSSTVFPSGGVTASLSKSALAGSVTFTVDRLAQSHGMRTAVSVPASTSPITSAAALAVSTTTDALGIGSISVGAGVVAGTYDVSVVQATAGATRTGDLALGASTVIDATNDTLTFELDGAAHSITLAAGTYSAAQLVDAAQTAIDAQGGGATAALDSSGRLHLTTTHEGSAATLQITGGSALTALGLSVDATAATGIDGSVKIGENAAVTVTSAGTGATIAVPTGTGDLTLTLDGGLRAGDAKVAVVSTGDRSLEAVAAAINSTNVGATAGAVKIADGQWILQVNSTRSGTEHALSLDGSLFNGGLVQTSAAQDAQITVGTGPGAYSIEASGNSFTDVLPGVTLTASAVSATPTTVRVARDDAGTADAVAKLIDGANSLLANIKMQTSYDAETKTASPLSGDSAVKRLAFEVREAVSALVGNGDTRLASTVGITTERDGQLKFDREKFIAALQNDPAGVERLFARGGTSADGIAWAGASDKTVAGEYPVEISQAATKAATGELATASLAGNVVGVRIGDVTAAYDAAAGATASEIAAGLNAALADAGLAVTAEASATGVTLRAVEYGTGGSFEYNLDVNGAGAWAAEAGIDVAGKINGMDAIGVGNRLRLLDSDVNGPARGLEVDVTVDVNFTGTLPVSYEPGIAARLVSLAVAQTGEFGALTTSETTYDKRIEEFTKQISRYEDLMVTREANLRRQWTRVQTMLASLQNQGNWLGSQIAGMTGQNQ